MEIHFSDFTQDVKFTDLAVGTVFVDDVDDIREHYMSGIQMKTTLATAANGAPLNTVFLDDGTHGYYEDGDIVYPINSTLEIKGA